MECLQATIAHPSATQTPSNPITLSQTVLSINAAHPPLGSPSTQLTLHSFPPGLQVACSRPP